MAIDKERKKLATLVVRQRDKTNLSWVAIGAQHGISPNKARALYDEVKGPGAHHGLLTGKGGRSPATAATAQPEAAAPEKGVTRTRRANARKKVDATASA